MLHCWFLLRARGQCQHLDRAPVALHDDQLLWLPPSGPASQPTRLAWHPSSPRALILLRFDTDALLRLLEPFGLDQLQPNLHPLLTHDAAGTGPAPEPLVQSMTVSDREFALGFRHPPVPNACLNLWCRGRVMEFLARRAFIPAPDPLPSKPPQAQRDLLARVKPWLLQHLDQPLNLDQLARHLAISRSHLSRRFSNETGMTLRQYLQALRMQHAARLIAEKRLPVSTAALEVGYQSLGHFSAAFKRHHGCLPSEWPGNGV